MTEIIALRQGVVAKGNCNFIQAAPEPNAYPGFFGWGDKVTYSDPKVGEAEPGWILRPCRQEEAKSILKIINEGAMAYRGAIPPDCWHDPYMSRSDLDLELSAGVAFHGYGTADQLIGVMGIQSVRGVDLIRHAYVRKAHQGRGVGSKLITHLLNLTTRPVLVGTWAAATWAIGFYERHGFLLVPGAAKAALLQAFWSVSPRQRDVSVVLSAPDSVVE